MKKVEIYKASRLTKFEEVPSIQIIIEKEVQHSDLGPEDGTLEEAYIFYQKEAKKLAVALENALPQATLWRLTAELMGRQAARTGFMGLTKE